MEAYLRNLEQTLRLDPEETRAIVAEVRGNLEDLIAHLKGQGLPPEEAEREALRRFDDAKGLANALRRAHRRAPLALHLLALALVVVGIAAIMLGADVLVTTAALALHSDGQALGAAAPPLLKGLLLRIPWVSRDTLSILAGVLPLPVPGAGILALGVASLWAAKAVVLGQRRPRWRRVGAFMGGMALCDLALAAVLASTLPLTVPRPVPIPGGARLAAAGLCFRPPSGAPARPVVVDQLCADRTATYVQYHIPNPPPYGESWPQLYDNRARTLIAPGQPQSLSFYQPSSYELLSCTTCPNFPGSANDQSLRHLVPWRSVEEGLARFTALDAHAHTAILNLGTFLTAPRAAQSPEVVRIPVDLRGLAGITGGSHPFAVLRADGVRFNLIRVVRGVSLARLSYTADTTPALGALGNLQAEQGPRIREMITDARGRALAPVTHQDDCVGGLLRHGGHCEPDLTFPTRPSGTHLLLVIRSLTVYPSWSSSRVISGPWRLPFVMP